MSTWTVFVRENLDRHLLVIALACGAIVPLITPTEASLEAYLAGAAGLFAMQERLRRQFQPTVALLTTLAIFGGTSLFWSMTRATSFVAAATFGFVAALLFLGDKLRIGRSVIWIVVAALPPLAQYLGGIPSAASLFSSSAGLLSLTPIVYLALLGTIGHLRRNVMAAGGALAVLAFWVAVGSMSAREPSTPQPFAHGLTPALATLAPGLAFLIDRVRHRPLVAVAPLVLAAIAWNYWLMVQYTVGLLPKDSPVSFADMVRQQADVYTGSPFVYPFAFPANVWFAWREGVPIDRYEILSAVPRQQRLDVAMDREVEPFLLEGWTAPGPDDRGPVYWIGERRASIVLPVEPPRDRPLDFVVTARARLEEPAVSVDMALEINGNEVGRFVVPPTAPADLRVTIPAQAVGRMLRAGYNRLTFVSHGIQRVDAGDQRAAGLPASRPGDRAWPVAIYRIQMTPAS